MFGRKTTDSADRLDNLQQDSWQLELIVTGFAVAGLMQGYEDFDAFLGQAFSAARNSLDTSAALMFLLFAPSFVYKITILNLLLHVLIRCLWIAALGLRSVVGNTETWRPKMIPRFSKFLDRRHPDFDTYVHRLDNLCSFIFAFTFLTVFSALALFINVALIGAMIGFIGDFTTETPIWWVLLLLIIFYVALAVFYFIDFISLGELKKVSFFGSIYYPFYRFFGWVSLARITRPLYYRIISDPRWKRSIGLAVVYPIAVMMMSGFSLSPRTILTAQYLDERDDFLLLNERNHYRDDPNFDAASGPNLTIPSDVIESSVLTCRIEIKPQDEWTIRKKCPELPYDNEEAVSHPFFERFFSAFGKTPEEVEQRDALLPINEETLACLRSPYRLQLNGSDLDLSQSLLYVDHEAEDMHYSYLRMYLPLDSLDAGVHRLQLDIDYVKKSEPDSIRTKTTVVPFYYAPQR